MNFKWPENKQEQIKYIALIAIVAVIVIVVLVMFVISPFLKAKHDYEQKLAELNDNIEKAQKEINKKSFELRRSNDALAKINHISENYMLSPVLGKNYLLSVIPIIERHCKTAGIIAKPPTELGINDVIPPPTGRKGAVMPSVKSYTARITMTCSYADIAKFVKSLENENPYLSVAGLSIVGRPAVDPQKHTITLDIQWPIWADPDMKETIRKQLKKGDEEENE